MWSKQTSATICDMTTIESTQSLGITNSERVALLNQLKERAQEFGMVSLGQKARVNYCHLYSIFSDNGNPTLATLLRLAATLGFEVTLRERLLSLPEAE